MFETTSFEVLFFSISFVHQPVVLLRFLVLLGHQFHEFYKNRDRRMLLNELRCGYDST